MVFPDLLSWKQKKKRGILTGSVEEIAAILADYEALGVEHLIFHLMPSAPAAYERLAQAVQLYRKASPQKLGCPSPVNFPAIQTPHPCSVNEDTHRPKTLVRRLVFRETKASS